MQNKARGFEKISPEQWANDFETDLTNGTIERVYDELQLPKRATKHSAGYDIFSPKAFILDPNDEIKLPTGMKVYMLPDEFLSIHTRSGLGFKYYARLANVTGIIDADYCNNPDNEGHFWVKIRNEGNKPMHIKKGDAIAQAIFQKYLLVDDDNFDEGEDRVGGFGSTSK